MSAMESYALVLMLSSAYTSSGVGQQPPVTVGPLPLQVCLDVQRAITQTAHGRIIADCAVKDFWIDVRPPPDFRRK